MSAAIRRVNVVPLRLSPTFAGHGQTRPPGGSWSLNYSGIDPCWACGSDGFQFGPNDAEARDLSFSFAGLEDGMNGPATAGLQRGGPGRPPDWSNPVIAATMHRPIKQGAQDCRQVSLTRVFNVPRERVFRAYTDPAAVAAWWGPPGCTITVSEMDVRPGGAWRLVQTEPDGTVCTFRGVYREVVAPERLVYAFRSEQTPGRITVDEVTLEDHGGLTKLSMKTRYMTSSDNSVLWG